MVEVTDMNYQERIDHRARQLVLLTSLATLVKSELSEYPQPDHTEAKALLLEELHPTAVPPPSSGTVRLPARGAYRPGAYTTSAFARIPFIKELRELNPELTLLECRHICDALYPDELIKFVDCTGEKRNG